MTTAEIIANMKEAGETEENITLVKTQLGNSDEEKEKEVSNDSVYAEEGDDNNADIYKLLRENGRELGNIIDPSKFKNEQGEWLTAEENIKRTAIAKGQYKYKPNEILSKDGYDYKFEVGDDNYGIYYAKKSSTKKWTRTKDGTAANASIAAEFGHSKFDKEEYFENLKLIEEKPEKKLSKEEKLKLKDKSDLEDFINGMFEDPSLFEKILGDEETLHNLSIGKSDQPSRNPEENLKNYIHDQINGFAHGTKRKLKTPLIAVEDWSGEKMKLVYRNRDEYTLHDDIYDEIENGLNPLGFMKLKGQLATLKL